MKHTTKFQFRDDDRFPGVVVTIRRVSHERRTQLESKTVKYYQKRQEIQREYAAIGDKDTSQAANIRRIQLADDIARLMNEQYKPEALRIFVQKIDGLEIENDSGDFISADVNLLISDGPLELSDAIFNEIYRHLELLGDEPKNSQLPITSTEPEDGQVPSTIAPSAVA